MLCQLVLCCRAGSHRALMPQKESQTTLPLHHHHAPLHQLLPPRALAAQLKCACEMLGEHLMLGLLGCCVPIQE